MSVAFICFFFLTLLTKDTQVYLAGRLKSEVASKGVSNPFPYMFIMYPNVQSLSQPSRDNKG